jgi:tetratricopeptide (TPR) repeat protein
MIVTLLPRPAAFFLILTALLAGCNAVGPSARRSAAAESTPTHRSQLRQALAHADRMTIAASGPDGAKSAVVELRTPAAVADFLGNVAFDEAYGPVRCDSPQDAVFSFYAGDKLLTSLSLHRLGYLRWANGPWAGDAVLTPEAAQWLQEWSKLAGADATVMLQAVATQEEQRSEAAKRRLLMNFTPAARTVFGQADTVVANGHHLRRIATPLAELYEDKAALAEAGLRALGDSPQRWMEDDWAVGAVQTALLELDPAVVRAAMDRLKNQDNALLGCARFFFRAGFETQFAPAERDAWAGRLADLVLRAGRDSDKHALLEYLAMIPGESTANFLRAMARGEKSYAYAPPWDELTLNIEEPGLRYAAALFLAKRGDTGTREILQSLAGLHPFGPDQAALEVAAALMDGTVPLKPAHFKYHSRTLGLAALSALEWRPGSGIPLDVLGAACAHFQDDVATRAEKIAQHYQLQRADDGTDDQEPAIDYDPLLATSYPRLAVEEYSALIPKVRGLTLARLYTLRAQAHSNLHEYAEAEADYANVAKTSFADGTDVRTRLAWVQWYLGKFDDAEQTIDDALQASPSADLVLLRGIMHYSLGDFQRSTEADLIAARVLDPKEGYAALLQHLVSALGGRPEQSQLKAYLAATPDLADWPRQLTGFLLGYIDAPRLLDMAAASEPNEIAWHTCEANFYASQAARVAGRAEEERKYLEQCVATNQPDVAEFWVAKFRLEQLRPGRTLPPVRSRSLGIPAI